MQEQPQNIPKIHEHAALNPIRNIRLSNANTKAEQWICAQWIVSMPEPMRANRRMNIALCDQRRIQYVWCVKIGGEKLAHHTASNTIFDFYVIYSFMRRRVEFAWRNKREKKTTTILRLIELTRVKDSILALTINRI